MGAIVTEGPRRGSGTPLVVTWLGVAVALGLLLAVARAAERPLDDPDPAWQRPGFLDAGELPAPAPGMISGVPAPGHPAVVFFERADRMGELCRALAGSSLPELTTTAIVVAGAPSGGCEAAETVIACPEGHVAEAYGMRRPRGGGPPVGYAVVDAAGEIRYRTLDPEMAHQLDEVSTIVAALP